MKILLDSWMVLNRDGNFIIGILFALLLAGGIVFFSLKVFLAEHLTLSENFSLSIAGVLFSLLLGISLLALLSFLFKFKTEFLFLPMLALVYGFMFFAARNKHGPIQGTSFSALALILILIVSIYVRLAFISRLIVPSYFDSAAHNLIINHLITSYQNSTIPTFDSLAGGYYHLGFHVLAAAFSLALRIDVKDIILVFGQIVLALIPLPLFFIVKQETGSDLSGLFAVLLAGWGWAMPAHAVNWGKYPALTSILAFEFTLSMAYLLLRSPRHRKWIPILVCVLGVCISTFIHSRALVLVGIALLCALAALGWSRLPKLLRGLVFLIAISGLVALTLIILSKPILSLALNPYLQRSLWISPAVVLLLTFGCVKYPRAMFSLILSLILLLSSLFVPLINLLPGYAYQTLLDRPFVEMILFVPLSILGGLGFAGLVKTLGRLEFMRRLPSKLMPGVVTLILFGLVFVNAVSRYDFYPSDCCQIFAEPDAVAFDWMDKNLPDNAGILIASSDIVLFESGSLVSQAGSDGGIWLTPLIDRKTFSMSYLTDFNEISTRKILAQRGIMYIYIGGTARSFREAQLQNNPSFYKLIFSLSGAHVYELVNVP